MAGAQLVAKGIETRRKILTFLRRYPKQHGYAPSRDEIASAIGMNKSAINHHLKRLEQEGWVTWERRRYRSLRVIREGRYS